MLIENSISRVRAYRSSVNWSATKFATEAGLSVNALKDIDRDEWSPTADTLRKLESIIPEDFFPSNERAA